MFELRVISLIFIYIFWWVLRLHRFSSLNLVWVYHGNRSLTFWCCEFVWWHFTLGLGTLLYLIFRWYVIPWLLEMAIRRNITAMLDDSRNSLPKLSIRRSSSSCTIACHNERLLTVVFDLTARRLKLLHRWLMSSTRITRLVFLMEFRHSITFLHNLLWNFSR